MRSACEQHTRGAARGSGRSPVARDAQAALAARRRRLQRTGATCSWRREPAQPRATALAAHARNTRKRSRPAPQPWGQHNTIRPVLAAVRGAHAEGQLQLEQLGCDGGLRRGKLPSSEFNSRASQIGMVKIYWSALLSPHLSRQNGRVSISASRSRRESARERWKVRLPAPQRHMVGPTLSLLIPLLRSPSPGCSLSLCFLPSLKFLLLLELDSADGNGGRGGERGVVERCAG